jgi:hypothetical protein
MAAASVRIFFIRASGLNGLPFTVTRIARGLMSCFIVSPP